MNYGSALIQPLTIMIIHILVWVSSMVNAQGQPVDNTTGEPKVFSLRWNPGNIIDASDALITIQQPGNNDTIPTGTKMIGGIAVLSNDYVSFNLSMAYSDILGNTAAKFLTDTCKYILNTPTTQNTSDWDQGIWLTKDTLGSSTGLTCSPLPDTGDWLYEGFIYLAANPNLYYSIGRFPNPSLSDDNNNCQGPAFQYDKPGQDWIDTVCTGNTIKLNSSAYNFMVTIRPKLSNFLNAHYIKLFDGAINVAGFGSVGVITNIAANYLPTGTLQISRE